MARRRRPQPSDPKQAQQAQQAQQALQQQLAEELGVPETRLVEGADRLTEEDEKILDAVAAKVTPEQMAASIKFSARMRQLKQGKEE